MCLRVVGAFTCAAGVSLIVMCGRRCSHCGRPASTGRQPRCSSRVPGTLQPRRPRGHASQGAAGQQKPYAEALAVAGMWADRSARGVRYRAHHRGFACPPHQLVSLPESVGGLVVGGRLDLIALQPSGVLARDFWWAGSGWSSYVVWQPAGESAGEFWFARRGWVPSDGIQQSGESVGELWFAHDRRGHYPACLSRM